MLNFRLSDRKSKQCQTFFLYEHNFPFSDFSHRILSKKNTVCFCSLIPRSFGNLVTTENSIILLLYIYKLVTITKQKNNVLFVSLLLIFIITRLSKPIVVQPKNQPVDSALVRMPIDTSKILWGGPYFNSVCYFLNSFSLFKFLNLSSMCNLYFSRKKSIRLVK